MTDIKEWQTSTGSVEEKNEAMKQVLWLVNHKGRSHGIDAGQKLMTAIIEAARAFLKMLNEVEHENYTMDECPSLEDLEGLEE